MFKVFDANSINDIPPGDPCDPWHTTGNKEFHSRKWGTEFIEWCKNNLTECEFNIRVGPTGYVIETTNIPSNSCGWCKDEYSYSGC